MKIYFSASISGGREDGVIYAQIVRALKTYGQVLSEHVGSTDINEPAWRLHVQEIYKRDLNSVEQADVLVAEVTTPGLGVGYEIAKAEEWGKKIFMFV